MKTHNAIHSDLPIPPGEYLQEVIDALGMTKDGLLKRTSLSAPNLSAIFKGTESIRQDTAIELERAVGVPAHIWAGLDTEYRLVLKHTSSVRLKLVKNAITNSYINK